MIKIVWDKKRIRQANIKANRQWNKQTMKQTDNETDRQWNKQTIRKTDREKQGSINWIVDLTLLA